MADVYIDFGANTGTLTGTWTFTNGAGMTAPDGDAVNELDVGDYVRQSDGVQWYKVSATPDADTITLSPVFQQATHTDDAGASLYNDTSVSGALNTDYVHHNQATTDTVRTAGDIIRTRGGLTYTYAGIDITFDEDGTASNYIELKGIYTAAGDDSWGDGDVAKPIIDFDNTAFQMYLNNDYYWKVTDLEIIQSTDGNGGLFAYNSGGAVIENCDFHDHSTGLRFGNGSYTVLYCTFEDNTFISLYLGTASLFLSGCSFNGGVGGTQKGLVVNAGRALVTDTTFGVTTEHSVADIDDALGLSLFGRNMNLASTTAVSNLTTPRRELDFVRIEDDGQVHGAYYGHEFAGDVTRSTAVERSGEGGTGSSMLMEPNSNCGSEQALHGFPYPPRGIPIYLDGTEQTITVYAYATSWAALPSVTEFVMEIEHYEGVADWEIDTTADTFAANDDWEAFNITLTPGAAGFAYLRVKLLDYEDGTEKIYVDPVPEIDGSRDESLIAPTVDGVGAGYEIVSSGRPRARYHNV